VIVPIDGHVLRAPISIGVAGRDGYSIYGLPGIGLGAIGATAASEQRTNAMTAMEKKSQ